MNFLSVLINVGIMLLYAVPGFILAKTKLIKSDAIKVISTILMYVCSPFLTIYSFQKISFSVELSVNLLIAFVLGLVSMFVMMMIMFFIFRKKRNDIRYRVASVCAAFGNEAFLGVPLMEALLPNFAEGAALCSIYLTAMNILGWTLACYMITNDKKYISVKRILLNPATIGFVISLVLYFFNFHFSSIPTFGEPFVNMITIIGRMSTPLCMIALGARLALMRFKTVFGDPLRYVVILVKGFIFPVLIFLAVFFLPLESEFKIAIVILSSVPVAQIAQNFCEMIGEGQEEAVGNCLSSTLLSIITLPIVCLLFALL